MATPSESDPAATEADSESGGLAVTGAQVLGAVLVMLGLLLSGWLLRALGLRPPRGTWSAPGAAHLRSAGQHSSFVPVSGRSGVVVLRGSARVVGPRGRWAYRTDVCIVGA